MTKHLIAISLQHTSMAKPPFGPTTSLGAFYQAVFQREMDLIEMFPLINHTRWMEGEEQDHHSCRRHDAWEIPNQYPAMDVQDSGRALEFYFSSVRTLTRVEDCIGNHKGRQLEFHGGNGCWGKDFPCHMPLEPLLFFDTLGLQQNFANILPKIGDIAKIFQLLSLHQCSVAISNSN
ncbi:hypothetical protein BKA83DRAFT_4130727 [Pisolithus microcarpus]|nr:hypothetical protein BKA83DRAFT_4130727 [Pisolithus microcarpus]